MPTSPSHGRQPDEGTMATLQEQLARLRRYNLSVRKNDPKLAEELRDRGFEAMVTEGVSPQATDEMLGLESIAMRTQRPVLAIRDNVTQLVFIDEADSKIWGERLTKARHLLDIAIPSVGRIDLTGGDLDFLQEIDNPERLVFKLVRPLHIEEPPGPDVSFFEIEMVSGDA